MKKAQLKELIKQSMTEFNDPDYLDLMKKADDTGRGYAERDEFRNQAWDLKTAKLGAMTPEEEKMVADYEEEEANKYALDKEEPMEEGSVILNRDEVYAKYAPLVRQYMESGLDKYAAIKNAQDDLAKEYGATSLNIQSTISDYFDDQDRNATYANEDVLREADEIVAAYAEKKTLNEEMHGGYLELFEMNPNFEEGVANLLQAWDEWKEGPETEPEMIEEAKHDILAYLSQMMK